MGRLKASFFDELMKRQKNYSLHPNCNSIVINKDPVNRFVVYVNNRILATIPHGTARHEADLVAEILQGRIRSIKYDVAYCIASLPVEKDTIPEYEIYGELTTIVGVVKDNVVIMLYPEMIGENKTAYDSLKMAAEVMGAKLESIVVRAYYKYHGDD